MFQASASAAIEDTLRWPARRLTEFFCQPAVAFLSWAVLLVLGLSLRDPGVKVLDEPWTYLLWTIPLGAILIYSSHFSPKIRDVTNLILGVGWIVAWSGLEQAACIGALALLVHFGFRKLKPRLAFFLTIAIALGLAKLGLLETGIRTQNMLGLAAVQLAYYAFEQGTLLPGERSFRKLLIYSPFSFSLGVGPRMIAYSTVFADKPREELTRMGVLQLYRSGLKTVLYFLILNLFQSVLPDIRGLGQLSFPWRALFFFSPYGLLFLRLSVLAEIGGGISNLAGYHVPNTFDYPLLARDPLAFWHKWNLLVLDFLRRVFIFDSIKWVRSRFKPKGNAPLWAVAIVVGFSATRFLHVIWMWIQAGYRLDMSTELRVGIPHIFWDVVGFSALLPLYYWNKRVDKMRLGAVRIFLTLAFWLATQSYFAQKLFWPLPIYEHDGFTDGGRCVQMQLFEPSRDCSTKIRRKNDVRN